MISNRCKEAFANISARSMITMTRQFRLNNRILVKHEGVNVSSVLEVSIHFCLRLVVFLYKIYML